MGLKKSSNEQQTNEFSYELTDENPDARRIAVLLSEDVDEICKLLETEKDNAVRQTIMSKLSTYKDNNIIDKLIPMLGSEDAGLRNDIIEVLKDMPNQIEPHMPKLLSDENPDIRIFAVNILESLKHPKVVPWLIEVISNDEHINVISTAIDLLAEVGDNRARIPLARVEEKFADEPFICFSVSNALERIAA